MSTPAVLVESRADQPARAHPPRRCARNMGYLQRNAPNHLGLCCNAHTTWTIFQRNVPNHLGLCRAHNMSIKMARPPPRSRQINSPQELRAGTSSTEHCLQERLFQLLFELFVLEPQCAVVWRRAVRAVRRPARPGDRTQHGVRADAHAVSLSRALPHSPPLPLLLCCDLLISPWHSSSFLSRHLADNSRHSMSS